MQTNTKHLEEIIKDLPPHAVHEIENFAELLRSRYKAKPKKHNLNDLLGIGLQAPLNPHPRFKNDDELWEKG